MTPARRNGLRIIVSGLVGMHPVGGVAWDYLQYMIGLARMGHDVFYYEDTWSWPYDPIARRNTEEASYSLQFINAFFRHHEPELTARWRYVHLHAAGYGMGDRQWRDVIETADVFINVSGASIIPDGLSADCRKVFIDTDPGYNQIILTEPPDWAENVERWRQAVFDHDVHFTYAENIGGEDCRVPLAGLSWKQTRMPVVLDWWDSLEPPTADAPWTTVMTWNAFKGPLMLAGREYRSKGSEFDKIVDLPARTSARMKVALGGIGAPVDRLRLAGWEIVDGPAATISAESYRSFIGGSRGEISPAKHVYVALRTGWFSTRTACYLAAGRPAIVQDTGFRHILPVGEGILPYGDIDEALDALERVDRDLPRHSLAARQIARDEFDAPVVLDRLMHDIDSGPRPPIRQ